jgi:hypothetical protein
MDLGKSMSRGVVAFFPFHPLTSRHRVNNFKKLKQSCFFNKFKNLFFGNAIKNRVTLFSGNLSTKVKTR